MSLLIWILLISIINYQLSIIMVLESLPLAVVSGGQVQIRWVGKFGLALAKCQAKSYHPNKNSDKYCQECRAKPAHSKPAHSDIASYVKPQESAHQEPAH